MAPPARHPNAAARRHTVATTAVSTRQEARHDMRRDGNQQAQLDWLQPALAVWLRDEASGSVRMGDVHPADGR